MNDEQRQLKNSNPEDKADMEMLEGRPLFNKDVLIDNIMGVIGDSSDHFEPEHLERKIEAIIYAHQSKQPTVTDEEIAIRLINKIAKDNGLKPDGVGLKINGDSLLTIYYGLDKK